MRNGLFQTFVALALLVTPPADANAQKYEVHPYAGGFFPGKFANVIEIGNEGIYGLKAGMFLTDRFEVEGNFGYINHLNFESSLTRTRAYIWEGTAAYHFKVPPTFYVSAGLGGVTATTREDSRFFFGPGGATTDTFLGVSYGGGMKSLRRWGPLGYRADVRGRTLPDYYGFRLNWLEATAGLTISWGER
jgi:hypothetical protein